MILMFLSGKKWQQRRKIINTAFDYDALAEFYDKAALKTKNLVQDLRAEAGTGGITKELYPITNSLTLEIISGKNCCTFTLFFKHIIKIFFVIIIYKPANDSQIFLCFRNNFGNLGRK